MEKSILLMDIFDDNISKIYSDSVENYEIFSITYFTHKQLLKKNTPHTISENYLNLNDRKLIDDYAVNATINWHELKSIKKYLTYDSINLGFLLEQELFHYFMSVFNKAIICKKIIETLKPKKVIAYTDVNNFIKQICDSMNIEIILKERPQSQSLAFDKINIKYDLLKIPISVKISRNTFFKLKNVFESFIFSLFNLNSKITSDKSILITEFNPTQYDLLVNELSKIDTNVIFLNQRRSVIWNLESFKIIKNSKCKILRLSTFEKKIKSIISNEINKFSKNLESLWTHTKDFEEFFSIDSFNLWNSIEKPFRETCSKRFLESVKRILLLNEFFKYYNISTILEWAELGQEEKELLLVSKKFNVESIMLQHALDITAPGFERLHRFVLGGYSNPYISNKQALWGDLSKTQALCYPTNTQDKILVTGSPRHDKFFLETKNKTTGTILLATGGVTGISQVESPFASYEKFDNFLHEIFKIIRKFPDKKLIVKTHPRSEFHDPITDLLKDIDSNVSILYNADIKELINSCELVITFNNSTIALEALILEKPVISLQMEKWTESEDIVKMGAIISVSNVDDIESNIVKIIQDEEFRNSLIKNGKTFLQQYMSHGGKSSKILANILNKYDLNV
jgi:uncharacterized membrane protein